MEPSVILIIIVGFALGSQIPKIMPKIDFLGVVFCVVLCVIVLALIGMV